MMGAIHQSSALHRIAKAVAVAARKEPTGTVELCDLPAAIYSVGTDGADEPGPLTAHTARCPPDRHPLVNGLPIFTVRSDAVVKHDLIPATPDADAVGCPVPIRPLPATQASNRTDSRHAPASSHRAIGCPRPCLCPSSCGHRATWDSVCLNFLANRARLHAALVALGHCRTTEDRRGLRWNCRYYVPGRVTVGICSVGHTWFSQVSIGVITRRCSSPSLVPFVYQCNPPLPNIQALVGRYIISR